MDDKVHPDHTLRLADRLIAANKDFELLIVPGAEHAFIDCLAYVRGRSWDFLVRELTGTQPPAYRPGADRHRPGTARGDVRLIYPPVAASCPQAAAISWPRVSRTVQATPAAFTRRTNSSSTGFGDASHSLPGVGLSGIRLTCTQRAECLAQPLRQQVGPPRAGR